MEKKRQRLQQEAVEIIAAAGQDTMNDGNDDDGAAEDSGHIEESTELYFKIDQHDVTLKAINVLMDVSNFVFILPLFIFTCPTDYSE